MSWVMSEWAVAQHLGLKRLRLVDTGPKGVFKQDKWLTLVKFGREHELVECSVSETASLEKILIDKILLLVNEIQDV